MTSPTRSRRSRSSWRTERSLRTAEPGEPDEHAVASALGLQESKTQQVLAALNARCRARGDQLRLRPRRRRSRRCASVASMSNLTGIRGDVADGAISMRAALADYDAIINAGYQVLDEALDQQTNVSLVTQATRRDRPWTGQPRPPARNGTCCPADMAQAQVPRSGPARVRRAGKSAADAAQQHDAHARPEVPHDAGAEPHSRDRQRDDVD